MTAIPAFGITTTFTNPPEKFGFDQSSKVNTEVGRDYQLGFKGDLSEKLRYFLAFGYNQQRVNIFHRYKESQQVEWQLDGLMQSEYLSLSIAPQWHKGEKLEFQYGLGFYLGALVSSSFTGTERVIVDNNATPTDVVNGETDTYRGLSTGLFTNIGLAYNINDTWQINMAVDAILFINAKNLIFQDTGSTNEVNARVGIGYTFGEPNTDE